MLISKIILIPLNILFKTLINKKLNIFGVIVVVYYYCCCCVVVVVERKFRSWEFTAAHLFRWNFFIFVEETNLFYSYDFLDRHVCNKIKMKKKKYKENNISFVKPKNTCVYFINCSYTYINIHIYVYFLLLLLLFCIYL